MEMRKLILNFMFISCLNILICVTGSQYTVRTIFTFGDSLVDAGNNRFNKNSTTQADFPPYGSSFFHYPTGRFTNGRIVPDFISEFLGIHLQKPYLELQLEIQNGTRNNYPSNGINFASAGSGVLAQTNNASGVTPLQVQLQQFQTLVEQNHIDKKLIEKSFFFLESGSNDIFNYFSPLSPPILTPDAYVQSMLPQVEIFVDTIYKLGARRIILFSLGPIGCVPARVNFPSAPTDKCFEKMNKMVENYSMGLENLVKALPHKNPDAIGAFGSVYETILMFRNDPKRYGFENVESACCGYGKLGGEVQCGTKNYTLCKNPDEYLFWDFFHPSERTYKLVSKALWTGGSTLIRPYNLKTLANMTLPRA